MFTWIFLFCSMDKYNIYITFLVFPITNPSLDWSYINQSACLTHCEVSRLCPRDASTYIFREISFNLAHNSGLVTVGRSRNQNHLISCKLMRTSSEHFWVTDFWTSLHVFVERPKVTTDRGYPEPLK